MDRQADASLGSVIAVMRHEPDPAGRPECSRTRGRCSRSAVRRA